MSPVIWASVLAFCHVLPMCAQASLPREVGNFKVEHPGFVTISRNNTEPRPEAQLNLIISRFNGFPFSTDYVSVVRSIGLFMKDWDSVIVEDLTTALHWPNEPNAVPDAAFNRSNMVLIPSGFLVPSKGVGALTIFDLNNNSPTGPFTITVQSEGDWFYHRAIWVDMDGDGKLDVVTCRAQKPLFGDAKGQLLWLQQPGFVQPWTKLWQHNIIFEGDGAPDTFLISAVLPIGLNETMQTLVTCGFFSHSLDIWYRNDSSQPWRFDYAQKRVVDDTEGDVFDAVYADLNADGINELLVTYNKPNNGTVFVYELPQDFRTGQFKKYMILDGINPAKSGVGKGAPGSAKLAWPQYMNTTGVPDILVSGDDNGQMIVLRPVAGKQWTYSKNVILDERPGTVGEFALADIDADGYTDIIVPCYDAGLIKVLTYNPSITSINSFQI